MRDSGSSTNDLPHPRKIQFGLQGAQPYFALCASCLVERQQVVAGNGAEIYRQACADCHGKDGEGKVGQYPALRDAVAATAPDPINAVRMVLYGGFAAATAHNPQPYSMPPFVQQLNPGEIAAVTNYVRETFGGQRSQLTAADVEAMHGIVLD